MRGARLVNGSSQTLKSRSEVTAQCSTLPSAPLAYLSILQGYTRLSGLLTAREHREVRTARDLAFLGGKLQSM